MFTREKWRIQVKNTDISERYQNKMYSVFFRDVLLYYNFIPVFLSFCSKNRYMTFCARVNNRVLLPVEILALLSISEFFNICIF